MDRGIPSATFEQLRLLVLKTAWLMDSVGNKGAHTEIQSIKIATPATVEGILDKAIPGPRRSRAVSQDFPLASMIAGYVHGGSPTVPTRYTRAPWGVTRSDVRRGRGPVAESGLRLFDVPATSPTLLAQRRVNVATAAS